jgi:lipopolysaccharide export system protein LptA
MLMHGCNQDKNPDNYSARALQCLMIILAGLVFILIYTPGLYAQNPGLFDQKQGQIRITAERMVMDGSSDVVEFTENVCAVQGDTKLYSDQLKIFYISGATARPDQGAMDENSIKKIEAEGNVIINMEDKTATGQKAVYTAQDGLLTLTGKRVEIKSADSVISGKKVTLNRQTGEIVVSGNGDDRVEAVFESGSGPGNSDQKNQ